MTYIVYDQMDLSHFVYLSIVHNFIYDFIHNQRKFFLFFYFFYYFRNEKDHLGTGVHMS